MKLIKEYYVDRELQGLAVNTNVGHFRLHSRLLVRMQKAAHMFTAHPVAEFYKLIMHGSTFGRDCCVVDKTTNGI